MGSRMHPGLTEARLEYARENAGGEILAASVGGAVVGFVIGAAVFALYVAVCMGFSDQGVVKSFGQAGVVGIVIFLGCTLAGLYAEARDQRLNIERLEKEHAEACSATPDHVNVEA